MPPAGASNLWSLKCPVSGHRSHVGFRACSCLLGYVVEWLWVSHCSLRTWVSWWFLGLAVIFLVCEFARFCRFGDCGCHRGPRRALGLLKYGHCGLVAFASAGLHINSLSCLKSLTHNLGRLMGSVSFLSLCAPSEGLLLLALGSEAILF